MKMTNAYIESFMNLAMLCVIYAILAMTFYVQMDWHQWPCPLCLMQRVGYIGIAFGFLMNFRFGFKPVHYTIVLISALFTAGVSLRQITLHIIPGTGEYGSPLFGYHLYTLSFLGTVVIIFMTSLLLANLNQYNDNYASRMTSMSSLTKLLFLVLVLILIGEIATVYSLCGFSECPGNPI